MNSTTNPSGTARRQGGSWTLEDTVNIPDRFNHAAGSVEKYRMYSNPASPVKHVFVHTLFVGDDGNETFGGECLEAAVCLVYFGFGSFVGGCEHDFHFPETGKNLELFLESLEKASKVPEAETGKENNRTPYARFIEAVTENMASCKPGWKEIFKENTKDDPVTEDELVIIKQHSPKFRRLTDTGIDAFDLDLTRDGCDTLVTLLNERSEAEGKDGNWYLAHEDEEMVHIG